MSDVVTESKTIRVLICDDHPVVRSGLKTILETQPGISVVGEAEDGFQAEKRATELCPDIVMMDVYMPHRDGIMSLLSIKQKLPTVKVLILTVSEEEQSLLTAIRLGADGYLLKKTPVDDIISAVRSLAAGQSILPSELTTIVMNELRRDNFRKPALTDREQQVLEFLAQGLTGAEIARRMVLSSSTVATYTHRLLHKLHMKNKAEAVAYAVRNPSRAKLGGPI